MTKPISRIDLRKLSKVLRRLFGVDEYSKFPVLNVLEQIGEVFPGTSYIVIEDKEMPHNVPARCSPDEKGNFLIEIKNRIYSGAYKQEIGAYRGFIVHEICHVFLYKIGFTPILERNFTNNVLPAYCSVEWQAKALCGGVMMPYEVTKNMSSEKLMSNFGVSKGFAEHRKRY